MNGLRVLRRFLAIALVLAATVLLTAAFSGHVQARTGPAAVPTATPRAGSHMATGIGMGQSHPPPTGIGMGQTGGLPVTGAGGTAGSNTVPPALPRTGGGGSGSSGETLSLVLAALVLGTGLVLTGWARRPALLR